MGASNHSWTSRLTIWRRRVLSQYPLSYRLPIQTSQICIHDPDLPPKHKQQRSHLSGHPPVPVVSGSHSIKGAVVNMFIIVRPQPWRPAGPRDCEVVQDWRVQVQWVRQGVDQEVRHVGDEDQDRTEQVLDPAFQHYLDFNYNYFLIKQNKTEWNKHLMNFVFRNSDYYRQSSLYIMFFY